MVHYKIVRENEIEHKNEYFELRILENGQHRQSVFFTTNEENLETTARALLTEQGIIAHEWHVIPHLKH